MARLETRGKVAAITGAAGGIGRALAVHLASQGCSLSLCDLDEAGLGESRAQCETHRVQVSTAVLDVSRHEEVFSWADDVAALFGSVHFVFNNAGATLVSTVANLSVEEFEWLMGVNFWGVVYGTMAFLPHLETSGEGHVVNVSSAFGLIGIPGQSAYSASKFAIRGFTEALSMELIALGSSVRAHVVHPGGVSTRIAANARFGAGETPDRPREDMIAEFERVARTSSEHAARVIVDGVRRGRSRIMVGVDARAISLLQRLFPASYQRIVQPGIRRRGLRQV